MKIVSKKVIQWTIFSTLFSIGFLALLVLAGDDDPYNLPLGEWFLIKFCAMVVIGLCVLIGKYLNGMGLIPETDENEIP